MRRENFSGSWINCSFSFNCSSTSAQCSTAKMQPDWKSKECTKAKKRQTKKFLPIFRIWKKSWRLRWIGEELLIRFEKREKKTSNYGCVWFTTSGGSRSWSRLSFFAYESGPAGPNIPQTLNFPGYFLRLSTWCIPWLEDAREIQTFGVFPFLQNLMSLVLASQAAKRSFATKMQL